MRGLLRVVEIFLEILFLSARALSRMRGFPSRGVIGSVIFLRYFAQDHGKVDQLF
jgi:hypothetical protein